MRGMPAPRPLTAVADFLERSPEHFLGPPTFTVASGMGLCVHL